MNNRGFLDISFAWLFAIVVGAIILFLAIFFTTKIINNGQSSIDAQTAKQIGILLDPLETGFETGVTTSIILPSETRIYNSCDNSGNFGDEVIRVSQQSFGSWTNTNIGVGFMNKYIFSNNYTQGKQFYIFSKPFNFPFKVADLMYFTSAEQQYCFVNAPSRIKSELSNLNQNNILIDNCSIGSIKICFGDSSCDINVNEGSRSVQNKNSSATLTYYSDALMYAAIFSEPSVYECQVKRLMQRTGQIASLYNGKANLLSSEGCSANLNLGDIISLTNSYKQSANLNNFMISTIEGIGKNNDISLCKLW